MTVENRYGLGTLESEMTPETRAIEEAEAFSFEPLYEGYHPFIDPLVGTEAGSFNIYHQDTKESCLDTLGPGDDGVLDIGWYWIAEFPGCMPDGTPMGPFPTAKRAYCNAQEQD